MGIKPASPCTHQVGKPLPLVTSIPGAGIQVVMSFSISPCCKRMAAGSILVIAMVSESLASLSLSSMGTTTLVRPNHSGWLEKQEPMPPKGYGTHRARNAVFQVSAFYANSLGK
jgi:hypothetical protein